ncbi:MAG: FIVAR domain-containing protein, partial [Oscillospiraceae bacterium]|nr:FIVAR domain-containing protein [Oscillospiraceae bacterium]
RVTADSDSVHLEFIPDRGLAAKIVESRYQSDTGMLNIYLAGTKALFPSSGSVKVGRVRISTSGSGAASAAVEAVRDSVKFVRSGELVSPDSDTDYPASVTLTAAGQSLPITQDPTYPNYSTVNYFPNITLTTDADKNRNDTDEVWKPVRNDDYTESDDYVGGNDDAVLEEQDTIGENMNPPDLAALLDALSRAGDYRRADYTESSYADLEEAVNKANDVISDPYATQDEIDEALLNVENAIGMLRPRNDVPSGAEGYSENKAGMVGGDSNYVNGYGQGELPYDGDGINYNINGGGNGFNGGSGSGGLQAAQDGNIVNASDGAQMMDHADDPFAGNDNGSKNPVLWIIVIAAIAVIAAVASIIVIKKTNDKKSADGTYFKSE